MRFRSISLFACAAFALAITTSSQTKDTQQARYAAQIKTMQVLGTWQGTTPCADCSGIITTLTLYQKAPGDFTHTVYREHLQYIDRGSFTSYGSWNILHGMPGNPDTTVYQLTSDKSKGKQYYLRVDEDTLKQLDSEMKPIDSKLNFTLTRIAVASKAGLANPASVNCVKQGGSLKIVTGKDGGQVGICIFPNGQQCEEWALLRHECSPAPKK